MNFFEAIISSFQRYFNFSLRASRSEFWYFILFFVVGGIIIGELDQRFFPEYSAQETNPNTIAKVSVSTENGPLSKLFILALFVPWLSVSARRLHDLGMSGWLVLVGFIPFIGWAMMIFWGSQPGEAGPNQYGDDPLNPDGHVGEVFE